MARGIRSIEFVRGAWGLGLLVAPRAIMGLIGGARIDQRSLFVARVLGARQLGQATLSGLSPSPEVLALGAYVDAAHAASAFALAGLDHDRARVGLIDGTIATAFAIASMRDARHVGVPSSTRAANWVDRAAQRALRILPSPPSMATK